MVEESEKCKSNLWMLCVYMSKTTIYFLRHGEVYNSKKILYGRMPRFSLSEEGKRQIMAAAEKLKYRHITHIYTSRMLRTRQTAQILAQKFGIVPKVSQMINEIKLFFEGMSRKEFMDKFQPYMYREKYLKQGQESIDSIARRMLKFTRLIHKHHLGASILVVSHGDPIMILRAKVEGVPFTFAYKKSNYLKTGDWYTLIIEKDHYI